MHNLKFYRNSDGTIQIRWFTRPIKDSFPKPFRFFSTNPFDFSVCEINYMKDEIFKRSESIRCSMSRTRKNIKLLALGTDKWKFFVTFTFDMLEVGNRYSYDNVFYYMSDFLHKLKRRYPDCQYLVVPELHKDGAIHFHGLFSQIDVVFFKKMYGHNSYNVPSFTYGYTQASEVRDLVAVSHYICKYMTKATTSVSMYRKRYLHSRSTLKKIDVSRANKVINDYLIHDFLIKKGFDLYEVNADYIHYKDFKAKPDDFKDFISLCSHFGIIFNSC